MFAEREFHRVSASIVFAITSIVGKINLKIRVTGNPPRVVDLIPARSSCYVWAVSNREAARVVGTEYSKGVGLALICE
jgi:hypothetical protein